jgi:uncharacterized YccA/Bax inhibitor family protein
MCITLKTLNAPAKAGGFNQLMGLEMKLWHKIIITIVVMLIASFVAGRLWFMALGFVIPSYLAGVVGGLSTILVWELMRWISKKSP